MLYLPKSIKYYFFLFYLYIKYYFLKNKGVLLL